MFLEALNNCGICRIFYIKVNVIKIVLQHPENKKVIPVKEPKVYLVGVYE